MKSALYTIAGEIKVAEGAFAPPRLLVFRPGDQTLVHCLENGPSFAANLGLQKTEMLVDHAKGPRIAKLLVESIRILEFGGYISP